MEINGQNVRNQSHQVLGQSGGSLKYDDIIINPTLIIAVISKITDITIIRLTFRIIIDIINSVKALTKLTPCGFQVLTRGSALDKIKRRR